MPNPQQIAALLDLPTIYVGKMQYMDTLSTKKYVWGQQSSLFCQPWSRCPPRRKRTFA